LFFYYQLLFVLKEKKEEGETGGHPGHFRPTSLKASAGPDKSKQKLKRGWRAGRAQAEAPLPRHVTDPRARPLPRRPISPAQLILAVRPPRVPICSLSSHTHTLPADTTEKPRGKNSKETERGEARLRSSSPVYPA